MPCPQSIEEEPNDNPMFKYFFVERDSRIVCRSAGTPRFSHTLFLEIILPPRLLSACKKLSTVGRERACGHASGIEIAHDKFCRSLSLGKRDS
jgi:hypothetical protein